MAFLLLAVVSALTVALAVARFVVGHGAAPRRLLPRLGAFDEIARQRLALRPTLPGAAVDAGGRPVPPALPVGPQANQQSDAGLGDVTAWAAAVADGAVPAVDVWLRWSAVDHHVFQAVAHLSHEQVDGFADLLRVVDAKKYALESAGFFNKLVGHVGEWHAQEHLIDAGHAVAMPVGSNEPGLDMWIDGHPANVKLVADAAGAAGSHFAEHPGIPIIVPHDAAGIPPDALHFDPSQGLDPALLGGDHLVIVDGALNHADVVSQTHEALDVLQDPGPNLHFPWVTAAVSTFREARLLVRGHTHIARSAKNVAVDTAAIGGGAKLGILGGAAAGAILGPVGAAVGGAVGGLLGALGGRHVANSIKRQPLVEAKSEYERVLRSYRAEEAEAVAYVSSTWAEAQATELARLRGSLDGLRQVHDREVERVRASIAAGRVLRIEVAEQLVARTSVQLDELVEAERQRVHAQLSGIGRLLPFLAAPRAYAQWQALVRDARHWRGRTRRLISAWQPTPEATSGLFDELLVVESARAQATAFVEHALAIRQRGLMGLRALQAQFFGALVDARSRAVQALKDRWEAIQTDVGWRLAPAVQGLRMATDHYRDELRRTGANV